MKYEAIEKYSQEHSVGRMCRVLNLAESSYYQWRRRKKEQEIKRASESKTIETVRKVFDVCRQTYGYRKMCQEMKNRGIVLSEYKIRRIMRENGLYPVTMKKYKPAGKGKASGKYYSDQVKQDFRTEKLNEVWAGDITYIKTVLGWVYLAVVIDLYNREIIGYSISKKCDTELVKRALANALAHTNGGGKNTVFHSDRGSTYCSKSFQKMLNNHGLTGSMSRAGCPYDNACVESFFSTAKRECMYRREYVDIDAVQVDLFEYIELFYNRRRLHATLGNRSPVAFRQFQAA